MVARRFALLLLAACLVAPGGPALPSPAVADTAPARADTLAGLGHRLDIAADGSAELLVTAVLGASGPAVLRLPFGYERATGFALEGGPASLPIAGDGTSAALRALNGRRLLEVVIDSTAAAGDTVRVSCRLEQAVAWGKLRAAFGAYDLTRRFVNDTEMTVGAYRLELVLPAAFRIRQITGSEPAFKPQVSPEPPYALARIGGRDHATLVTATLRPGDRVRLGLVAERAGRGRVPVVAGVLLAALYLVFFRTQVSRSRPAGAGGSNREGQV